MKNGCARVFCGYCGGELIHRDNRKNYEASSAFNQIMHREGPVECTCGDIDTYFLKIRKDDEGTQRYRLLIIEHKQPDQRLRAMQFKALSILDQCLQIAVDQDVLEKGSGVVIMRGLLRAESKRHKRVDFGSKQVIESLYGEVIFCPQTRDELWSWMCGGESFTKRNEEF